MPKNVVGKFWGWAVGDTGTGGTYNSDERPSLVPIITDVLDDPMTTGSMVQILGSGFGNVQGGSTVTQDQTAVAISLGDSRQWSSVAFVVRGSDIEATQLKYGLSTFTVNIEGGGTTQASATVIPFADQNYSDIASVSAAVNRITAIPDLAAGDQLRYDRNLVGGSNNNIVVVNADGTFSVDGSTPRGGYYFKVRAWDSVNKTWGREATQIVLIGTWSLAGTAVTPTQAMADYLRAQGYVGGMGDLQLQWFVSMGFLEGSLNDRWVEMMDSENIPQGGFAERINDFYTDAVGPLPNEAINELKRTYWLSK